MPTLEQIAKSAGVSRKTVARALDARHEAKYAPTVERFDKIRRLANELGYRPNASAKAVRTGRFGTIGCLHSGRSHNSHANAELMRGIFGVVSEQDLLLTSTMYTDEQLTQAGVVPKLLREMSADGLLIDYLAQVPEGMPEMIRRFRIPSIWINIKHETDCVRPNDIAAGRMATEHLLERGHRKILYGALNKTSHYSHKDRLKGYCQAMCDAGFEPVILDPRMGSGGNRLRAAHQWFDQNDKPDAIVTPGPGSATPLVTAALTHGYEVGPDVACVTVHDVMDRSCGIDLTTVIVPFEQVGRRAVNELLLKIKSPDEERPSVEIEPTIEIGCST